MIQATKIQLRHLIEDSFNLSEIKTLCHDLNIKYDNLDGNTLSDKSRELVDYIERHSQNFNSLIKAIANQRPNIQATLFKIMGGPTPGVNPYRGLFSFREQDSPFFFGRDFYIQQLSETIQKSPFMAVIGPSGSGKSSLVYAGLFPEIRPFKWIITTIRPSSDPFYSLASTFGSLLDPDLNEISRLTTIRELKNVLQNGTVILADVINRLIEKNDKTTNVLLFIDQFEELFTLGSDISIQNSFVQLIQDAISTPQSKLKIVITLRADFLEQALTIRSFADIFQDQNLLFLGPMSEQEIKEVIEKPAYAVGASFEENLVDRIQRDLLAEPGHLPLLEFALTLLWEQQINQEMTHAQYDLIGEVSGALGRHADQVYSHLNPVQQSQMAEIFVQLVMPGEGTEHTRRIATKEQVGGDHWPLVQLLANERLLVTNQQNQDSTARSEANTQPVITVELAHEALIRHWEKLIGWIREDYMFRLWQERLRQREKQWQATSLDRDLLLRGSELSEAKQWVNKRYDQISKPEILFVTQSQKQNSLRQGTFITFALIVAISLTTLLFQPVKNRWLQRQAKQLSQMESISASGVLIGDETISNISIGYAFSERVYTGSDFLIEQVEVTNRRFLLCVEAGVCGFPQTIPSNYEGEHVANQPVRFISAVQAHQFCDWIGRRLPTAAEWEVAAREPDGRPWPWGSENPIELDREDFNIDIEYRYEGIVWDVGLENSRDKTHSGVSDMAGNVREWTSTFRSGKDYFETVDLLLHEDTVLVKGNGADFYTQDGNMAYYQEIDSTDIDPFIGFRCVKD